MRNKHIVLIGATAIIILLWSWHGRNKRVMPTDQARPGQIENRPAERKFENNPASQNQNTPAPASIYTEASIEKTNDEQRPLLAWMEQQYRPISFYGKVVDENNAPIPEASIHFEWSNVKGAALKASRTSDNLGLFSLTSVRGRVLGVHVSKAGYYPPQRGNQIWFNFGDPARGVIAPDASSPIIFQLRKQGQGVDVVTSEYGVRQDLGANLPTNGAPAYLDFFSRKVGQAGQLQIQLWNSPKSRATGKNNWGLRLTVPDGGLVRSDEEFPFEAPETNYQSMVEWRFDEHKPDWQGHVEKSFFIQFGQPARYGRLTVSAQAFSEAVFFQYAVNPSGSRNLEPKAAEPTRRDLPPGVTEVVPDGVK